MTNDAGMQTNYGIYFFCKIVQWVVEESECTIQTREFDSFKSARRENGRRIKLNVHGRKIALCSVWVCGCVGGGWVIDMDIYASNCKGFFFLKRDYLD